MPDDRSRRLHEMARWTGEGRPDAASEDRIAAAAVVAYQVSLKAGRPISERKLAAMFGKTSRRWARHRMAEARQAAQPGARAAGHRQRPHLSDAGASLP